MKKRVLSLLLALCLLFSALPLTAAAAESYLWPVPSISPNSHISANYNADGQGSLCITGGGNILAAKSGTVVHVYSGCVNNAGYASGGKSCTVTGCTAPQKQTYGSKKLCNYGYGNGVILRHDDGGYSFYGHLSSVSVSNGAYVKQGQVIGVMGASGCSTGTHLYFILSNDIEQRGNYIKAKNPINSQTMSYISEVPKAQYTITFDAQGGTADYTSKTVAAGDVYGSLPNATRPGYLFLGWSPQSGVIINSISSLKIQGDHTLYAQWDSNLYTVTFDPNGGTVSPSSRDYNFGEPYGYLPTPTRDGYTFAGWFQDLTPVNENTTVTTPYSHTLTAHWRAAGSVTVTQDSNGGYIPVTDDGINLTMVNIQVTPGQPYGQLHTPQWEGHTFTGWYTQEKGGSLVTAETIVTATEDHTIYAHWRTAGQETPRGELYRLINQERTQAGLSPLNTSSYLNACSTIRVEELFQSPSHTRPDGRDWRTILEDKNLPVDVDYSGEIFCVEYDGSAASALDIFLNSPPHKEILMDEKFNFVGIGHGVQNNVHYWVVNFTYSTELPAENDYFDRDVTPTPTPSPGGNSSLVVYFGDLETKDGKVLFNEDNPFLRCWLQAPVGAQLHSWKVSLTDQEKNVLHTDTVPEERTITQSRTQLSLFSWREPENGILYFPDCQLKVGETYYYQFEADVDGETCHSDYIPFLVDGEPPAETFTITFNASGGTVSPISKTVTNGEFYGELPTPTRSGYRFNGWYTVRDGGGQQVTEDTIVSLTGNQTLFASWTAQGKTPNVPALTYNFGNNRQAYGYSNTYRIPLERYQLIYGNTSRAQTFYQMDKAWGGNCFGMSSTSTLFFLDDNGVNTSDFRAGSSIPHDLAHSDFNGSWGLSLRDFIEAMQIGQYDDSIQNDYRKHDDLNGLVQAVKNFHDTGADPVVVAVFGPEGGHAIVGYDLVDVDDTHSDLKVYDCNYPNSQDRVIRLTKTGSGNYTGWYYFLNDTYNWGSEYSGCSISYVPYAHYLNMWNNRKGGGNVNLLTVNSREAVIRDVEGNVAATIQDGQLITDREDIYPLVSIGLTSDGTGAGSENVGVWLPSEAVYSISNQDPAVTDFEVSMVHEDQSAAVSTTGGEVTLAVDDSQELNYVELAEGSEYNITLSSTLDTGHNDIQLKGTAGGGVALAQFSGSLFGKGVEGSADLLVDGNQTSVSKLTSGWANLSDILNSAEKPLPFTDVRKGAWFYEPIKYVYNAGLMAGVSDTIFNPNAKFTRAQAVTVLWQLSGSPKASTTAFKDVSSGAWYASPVAWASQKGIAGGTGNGNFSPNQPITRQDFALMLYGYAKYMGYSTSGEGDLSGFLDTSSISSYARPALQWAYQAGLITGKDGGRIDPKGLATRAEAATILRQFRENVVQ